MAKAVDVVEFKDLSPRASADSAEEAWLLRLAEKLTTSSHILAVGGRPRLDDEDPPALARDGDGKWWAGRFIGELTFEGRTLRIVPRLGIEVIGEWLAMALNLSFIPRSASLGPEAPLMASLLDRVWSAALADASRHGGPRLRRVDEIQGPFVKGALDVKRTIRLRGAGHQSVASRRLQRDLHNPVARAIVLADRTLRSLLGRPPDWRPDRAEEVLSHLRGAVGERPPLPSKKELGAVRYTPISRRFRSVAHLSLEIASHSGRLTSGSDEQVSGFLIDVAELWELYLLHCTRKAFTGLRIEHGTSESDRHLLESVSKPATFMGRIKPDIIVLERANRVRLVIDAKYKRLSSSRERPSGVDRGDLYQLTSYMAGHPSAPEGLLLYPAFEGDEALAETSGPWQLNREQVLQFKRISPIRARAIEEIEDLVALGGTLRL